MSEAQDSTAAPPAGPRVVTGRCHMCGYDLRTLPLPGTCPECGTAYVDWSITRLRPWPSALRIVASIGWPFACLALAVAVAGSLDRQHDKFSFTALVIGYVFLLWIPIHLYITIRRLLKRHLPERTRTTGFVAVFRALGTVICIMAAILILSVGVFLGGCLIILSGFNL